MKAVVSAYLVVLVAVLCSGCGKPTSSSATNSASSAESITNYPAHGVVQALRPDGKTVVIKHDEVVGYMMAMTMPFDVKDTNELSGLKPGDIVDFRLRVTEKDGWIDQIRVATNAPATKPATNAPTAIHILPNVPSLNPGDVLPDYVFTNELGGTIYLADYRGKALAFTFIFTRCPFPDFCPRMSDRFEAVQKRLKADAAAPMNWHLLSVSFDPAYDTPETLGRYGRRFSYDPERWSLASGSFDQIERLAGHFGLYFSRDLPPAEQNHNLRTVVVDTRGKVQRVFIGNEWTADELVAELTAAAKVR